MDNGDERERRGKLYLSDDKSDPHFLSKSLTEGLSCEVGIEV